MPIVQWSATVDLLEILCRRYPDARVVGHTDHTTHKMKVTRDRNKICPGRFAETEDLRCEALAVTATMPLERCLL